MSESSDIFRETGARHSATPAHPVPVPPRHRIDLDRLAFTHVAILVVGAAWWLGGQTEMARAVLNGWASFGPLLTIAACFRGARGEEWQRKCLVGLWPLAVLDLLVGVSTLNPTFREVTDGAATYYVFANGLPRWTWLPTSARPTLTLESLWFINATYLSAFNLLLLARHRRTLRALLFVLVANAAILAVFGSLQKLLGAKGLYFGAVGSPQAYFFGTFIYHNHWGAFALLMLAAAMGLMFHFARRSDSRDFWHSPGMLALVAVSFVAASLPLSTSRSTTLLGGLMLTAAFLAWLVRLTARRRRHAESIARPALFAIVALAAVLAFAYHLAEPIVRSRLDSTRQQFSQIATERSLGSRAILYRDTWRLARERPWFGWGLASYPTTFFRFNTQNDERLRRHDVPMYFQDAHSDWLQSVAEVGVVGTALLGLCVLVPLCQHLGRRPRGPIVTALLAGGGLVAAYAWVEFPFGNRAVVIAFWVLLFSALAYSRLAAPGRPPPCFRS